jgi:hypothetical protein
MNPCPHPPPIAARLRSRSRLVNIISAVTGIVGALALLKHSTHPDKSRLSLSSTILGSAALFGIVFGASKAKTNGWSSGITIGSLVADAALPAAFVLLLKYNRHQLVPLRVVLNRNRGGAYLVVGRVRPAESGWGRRPSDGNDD